MAKRLNKFPVTDSRGGKIAQEKWFDGSIWELSPDEVGAYKDIATCRRALYQLARRRGWKNVKTTIVNVIDNTEIPDNVIPFMKKERNDESSELD